jgi:hypothetical protein
MMEPEEPKVETPVNSEPADQSDEERGKEFIARYGEMVKETGMDFASYPVYVPDGQGGFRTVIQTTPVNMKNHPQKSPFIPQQ